MRERRGAVKKPDPRNPYLMQQTVSMVCLDLIPDSKVLLVVDANLILVVDSQLREQMMGGKHGSS